MATTFYRRPGHGFPAVRVRLWCITAAVLVSCLLTPSLAFEGPGIESNALFSPHLYKWIFIHEETGAKIMLISDNHVGAPPSASVSTILKMAWDGISPFMATEVRGQIKRENGWDTQIWAAGKPGYYVAAKLYLLNKTEFRAIAIRHTEPISTEVFDKIIKSITVWPRDAA